MSLPDIIIIVWLLVFALAGLRRGLVWELLITVGLALGFGLTYYFRQDIVDLAQHLFSPGWQRQWGGVLVFLVFFLLVYLGFATLGKHLHEGIVKTPFKWPDRILGIAAGVLKGAMLIALLVMVTEWFDPGGRVRGFMNQSLFIRWGKQTVHSLIYWEPSSRQQWV